jgi:DNA-binding transcriptional LysR family regulator
VERWDDLRVLLAIERAGSLASAAEILGVNKTTVLRRLDALEHDLGVALVRRSSRGVDLTEHSGPALEAARRIAEIVTDVEREIGGLDREPRGVVTVTAPVFFARSIMVGELAALREQHPKVEVHVLTTDIVLDMRGRAADIAVRNTPPNDGAFVRRRAGAIALGIYASHAYLERRPVSGVRADLLNHQWIGLETAVAPADGLRWIDELAPPVAFRATDQLATLDAARAGIGLAVLPCMIADAEATLVRLDQIQPPTAVTVWLVIQADLKDVPRVRAVSDWLLAMFAKHASTLCPPGPAPPRRR